MRYLCSLIIACIVVSTAFSAVLTVDNRPGSVAMFSSIQSAYNAAQDGDTILVAGGGANYGNVVSYKRLNWISGPTSFAQLDLDLRVDTILGDSSGSLLQGLNCGLTVRENVTGVIVERCTDRTTWNFFSAVTMRECNLRTNAFFLSPGSSGTYITNSILHSVQVGEENVIFDHCYIDSNFNGFINSSVSNTVFSMNNNNFTLNGSTITNSIQLGFDELPTGGGNIITPGLDVNDVFANSNLELAAGSPGIDAGTAGTDLDGSPRDIGIYGGQNPYPVTGLITGIPRITRLVAPATATDSTGLVFELDAEAYPRP